MGDDTGVVGTGVVGAGVVGAAVVGAAEVGAEVGWVAETVGAGDVGLGAGAPGLRVGFGDGPAELRPAAGVGTSAGAVTVTETGAVHDSVYFAGLEAAATGLVTTSTASPDAGSADGVILSGARVFVPAARKVTVCATERRPSASAQ